MQFILLIYDKKKRSKNGRIGTSDTTHTVQTLSRLQMNLNGLFDSSIDIIFTRILAEHDVDWESSAGNRVNRRVAKEISELGRVHCGRSDN